MKQTFIIDYGSGNIRSVYNAIKKVSTDNLTEVKVTSSANDLKNASHIILPGVGSFESCLLGLEKSGIKEQLIESVLVKKTPFLGICVGMQMLATKGYENGEFLSCFFQWKISKWWNSDLNWRRNFTIFVLI